MGRPARKQIQVWCLGPGALRKPHQFWSSEKSNRVCSACRRLQVAHPISPLLERMEKAEPDRP